MGIANGSRFRYAVAAVCVLAALLTGCSRDPNVRKQKYLESGQRYFDKGQYREAEIQFENAIQVDSRFADAHYKLVIVPNAGHSINLQRNAPLWFQVAQDWIEDTL